MRDTDERTVAASIALAAHKEPNGRHRRITPSVQPGRIIHQSERPCCYVRSGVQEGGSLAGKDSIEA